MSTHNKGPSTPHIESGRHIRSLTLFDGISTIVGLMVGSGIFSTAGKIQQDVGSPGLALALWTLTGILALTGALCYAELGTMIPGSGGEAQYLGKGFGPLMVFLFNWSSIMILKPGTVAILSSATAGYLLRMLYGILNIDVRLIDPSMYSWIERAVAVGCCISVTLAASLSTKWSNRIQGVLTLGKIGALALVIGSGFIYAIFVNSTVIKGNLSVPFKGSYFKFDSFARALNNGLWAFEGWNNLNIVSGDLVNPSVNLPLSIWSSMIAVVTLYLLTLLGYYSVLPKALIEKDTIGIDFGLAIFGKAGGIIMPILIASSTFGAALSSMVTSSEIIVLAAETGQIPSYFRKISPTLGTAARAYWMQGLIASCMALVPSFDILIMVYTFPTWIFYAACTFVLLKLRFTEPELDRPYKVFLSTPILFLLASIWLMATSFYAEYIAVGASFAVVLLGVPLYYVCQYFLAAAYKDDKGKERLIPTREI